MNQKKQDKGFTLVELLIVIVILGILAAVTVFAVRGITDKAQTNSCDIEKDTIETAIAAFNADTQTDADSVADLTTGTNAYLKDDLAFHDVTTTGPVTATLHADGRWDIDFTGANGPEITGVGKCA